MYIRSYTYHRRVIYMQVAYRICGCTFANTGTPDELPLSKLGTCGCTFAFRGTPGELHLCKLLMVYAGVHSQLPQTSILYATIGAPDELPVNELGVPGCTFAATGTQGELPVSEMEYAGVHSQLQVRRTSYLYA
ncbi:unnamed protein product [Toxocara canis]|uniref:SWIM-type domain-containing protein n=1 Tax=Toxocara canis TaxID=6265 RepID=A0A183U5X3_TOXCA|nr:unnamed protein product [Toxocara canis]